MKRVCQLARRASWLGRRSIVRIAVVDIWFQTKRAPIATTEISAPSRRASRGPRAAAVEHDAELEAHEQEERRVEQEDEDSHTAWPCRRIEADEMRGACQPT